MDLIFQVNHSNGITFLGNIDQIVQVTGLTYSEAQEMINEGIEINNWSVD
jgi:hypothetical protein